MTYVAIPARSGADGFTMIELMVVLVILAVGLALVAPRFGNVLGGLELKGAARDVASGLRYARGRSIATREESRFLLDVEQGRYWITGREREHRLPRGVEVRLLTGASEVVADGIGAITFFPDGSSTGGRVTLASGDRSYRVDVRWLTGQVRIDDGD